MTEASASDNDSVSESISYIWVRLQLNSLG